jgi:hypothetical protein
MIRLVRKPSLWLGFLGRLVFCIVWAGAFFGISYFVWNYRRAGTPWFMFLFLGFFDLIAIGVVWDIVVRFWRTLTNKQPEVSIDHDNLQLGSTAQVQFTEPNPESLADISVRLVAEHTLVFKSGTTKTYRTERCYDEELLAMHVDGPDPITRSMQIRIPAAPLGSQVRWMITVNTMLRQGGLMQHAYPFKVTSSRA